MNCFAYLTLESGIWKAGSSGATADVVEAISAVGPLLLLEVALTADSSAASGVTDACSTHDSIAPYSFFQEHVNVPQVLG